MDVSTLTQLISTVGFPIVCCGAMAWYVVKKDGSHKDEIDSLRTALENNTKVMTRICEKLHIEEE